MARNVTYFGVTITPEQKSKIQRMADWYFGGNNSHAIAALIDGVQLPEQRPQVSHMYKPLAKIDREAEQQKRQERSTANNKAVAKRILEGK